MSDTTLFAIVRERKPTTGVETMADAIHLMAVLIEDINSGRIKYNAGCYHIPACMIHEIDEALEREYPTEPQE